MAREPDAIKKTELQIPAARGMFAPHLKCLHLIHAGWESFLMVLTLAMFVQQL